MRLKDVARVELGSKDYDFIGRVNGKEATLLGIFLQPGANALEVADECNKVMHALAQKFPEGLTYSIPYDTTRFVKVSIREVVKTLAEAMALVFVVVFVFLQNWRATLIPFAAVPVSLIGTFAGLYLLGYSINTLTLFGMVLSIGIVVDDAIVVLENIERIMHEEHKQPREAAIQAMNEVTGPVVAIVLTLCAVFVPIAFLGGLTGELYRQFSVTISIAVVISGIVALTLTPSLCVLILKRRHRPPGRFFRWFNDWFHGVTVRYADGVGWMLRRGAIGLILFVGMVAVAAGLWRYHARQPGARRGPGLLHRRGVPARRRHAAAHRPGGAAGGRGDPVQPRQRVRGRLHRPGLPRRRASATARPPSSSPRGTGTTGPASTPSSWSASSS